MKWAGACGLLAGVLLCITPALAAQECDETRTHALLLGAYPAAEADADNALHLTEGDVQRRLTAVCKVWPARPQFTLLAVNLEGQQDADQGLSHGDLEVLVVANDDDQVRYRQRQANLLDGDAIFVDGLSLDTAPYQLSSAVMAFGVRIARRNLSQPNPFYSISLRLYAVDTTLSAGQELQLVLRNLEVESSGGEWDMQCAGERSETLRTLAIKSARPQQRFHDMVVRGKVTETTSAQVGAECEEAQHVQPEPAHVLVFDGQSYPVPEALQGLDDDYAP
jgi:hypothetical protein